MLISFKKQSIGTWSKSHENNERDAWRNHHNSLIWGINYTINIYSIAPI